MCHNGSVRKRELCSSGWLGTRKRRRSSGEGVEDGKEEGEDEDENGGKKGRKEIKMGKRRKEKNRCPTHGSSRYVVLTASPRSDKREVRATG